MFLLYVLHLCVLGVLPVAGIMGTLYQERWKDAAAAVLTPELLLILLILAIPALFLILGYSFFLAQLYRRAAEPDRDGLRIRTPDYLLMVLSPIVYSIYEVVINRQELLSSLAAAGVLSILAQHLVLHLVSWAGLLQDLRSRERQTARPVIRLVLVSLWIVVFLILGVSLGMGMLAVLTDPLDRALYFIALISGVGGSLRFFISQRDIIREIYTGETPH